MIKKLTIIVGGQIASIPYQGGAAWAVLQYILGLQELGHRTYFIEQIPEKFLIPSGTDLFHSQNASYFRTVMEDFGLGNSSALVDFHHRDSVGMDYDSIIQIIGQADALINLSGYLPLEPFFRRVPVRLYLDLDPLFTQLWNENAKIDIHFAGHTHFATVGMAVGSERCEVPTGGLDWITTWQPVVLTRWPASTRITWDAATTVANWRSYGPIQRGNTFYGQKAHSWREYMNLPLLRNQRFAVALSIDPGETNDLNELIKNHWELIDPREVASTPHRYQEFIQGSRMEFAIAKSGYAISRCGWFSDRSECYLASGKPVLAQATGFEQYLPCEAGVFAFDSKEKIAEALNAIDGNYSFHCRAARQIAEEYFDSRKVLTRLLARIGIAE